MLYLRLVLILVTCLQCTTNGLSAIPGKKSASPKNPLIDRRKSPALWREDLSKDDQNLIIVPKDPVKSEVMAPCGGWPQLRAAIGNGADAVFLGLGSFSARARAANFDVVEDLPAAVKLCHNSDVKVYVAFNTLVFDHELDEVSEILQLCERAGVDALIVQDLGVAKLARRVAPNLAIHSSTQQTITSSDGVEFCKDQHEAERVVLGRELSVSEIQQVTSQTNVEIETFVHGALCVSYSGQCFSSEAWGGRSANRGQCAQACRLPYGLIANGELIDLKDFSYLLSPQDLCGIDHVQSLMEAGVSCLKIEGRLKDEKYVAATTRAYRNAVDSTWKKLTGEDPSRVLTPEHILREELAQIFSRGQDEEHQGLTPGFLGGTQHQMVVRGRSPRHRGVHVGRVESGSSPSTGLVISTNMDLKLGDGLVVDRGMAQEEELGGTIFGIVQVEEGMLQIQFSRDVMKKWKRYDDLVRKGVGSSRFAPFDAHVWRTSDANVAKKMRRLSESPPPRLPVTIALQGKVGSVLSITITDGQRTATGTSDALLENASTSGLSVEKITKAIGKLGNTKWTIHGEVDVSKLGENVWCPVSQVKEARRRAVANWERQSGASDQASSISTRTKDTDLVLGAPSSMLAENDVTEQASKRVTTPPLSVLARTMKQVEAVCSLVQEGRPIREVIIDFLEVDGMREGVKLARDAGLRVVVASPRIIKPGESQIWRTLLKLEPDALLIRSTGLLYRMASLGSHGDLVDVGTDSELLVKLPELQGDFSLNAANALTAMELLQYGLEKITASYDMNANAIASMASFMGSKAQHLEVIVHSKLPVFHTEHCVFARFLSKGNSYLDCGHVCTRNSVHLRDQSGHDHVVLADMGCRNTVFGAEAQSGCHSVEKWRREGVGSFRVELVDENMHDSLRVVEQYLGILDGSIRPRDAWEVLSTTKDSNGRESGVTLGSFNNHFERRAGELAP